MKVFNTLTREKEEFVPMIEGQAGIYSCGPTVYNYFHIGNARPFITFDTLRRYLEYRGYKVTYVQNFTDIDDRMITQANAEGISVREMADRYIREYFIDADQLSIKRSTFQPRATDCMEEIILLIRTLEEKGFTYTTEDGVYYDVEKFESYGKLSNYNLDELEVGASDRGCVNDAKKSKADFALWKFKKEGEPSWPSPWGDGRPGWHIECSAMSKKYLGETIDFHCGGKDLIFPHHENEIAQSEAASGKPFVHYWMHNGFININNQKMSKSAGNFFTIRDIVQKYSYDVIRFFILSSHYRSPINFSDDLLEAADASLGRIRNCVDRITFVVESGRDRAVLAETESSESTKCLERSVTQAKEAFLCAMDDDLNTADAIAAVFDLVREANTAIDTEDTAFTALTKTKDMILELCGVMGIKATIQQETPQQILDLVEQRAQAKKQKNFALADNIRNMIQALGYTVSDTPTGPNISKL